MKTPFIKICGITRVKDAHAAIAYGAHALGFVLTQSKRCLSHSLAQEILSQIPQQIERFGIIRQYDLEHIRPLFPYVDVLQVHGNALDLPSEIDGVEIVPVIEPHDINPHTIERLGQRRFVIDGSCGQGLLTELDPSQASLRGTRFILAGGLHSGNVAERIRAMDPHGVDVSSGVEVSPGIKSNFAMREFCNASLAAFSKEQFHA